MEKDIYRYDLHMHPLCHEYYPNYNNRNSTIQLNNMDKKNIEDVIRICIDNEIDIISITDHDMIQSSLYAKEYIYKNNLPINLVLGTEVEFITDAYNILRNPSYDGTYDNYHFGAFIDSASYGIQEQLHLSVLGLERLPIYPRNAYIEHIKQYIHEIHDMGGMVIINHPLFSRKCFYELIDIVDGFEAINNDVHFFEEGSEHCAQNKLDKIELIGSDFHYMPSCTFPRYNFTHKGFTNNEKIINLAKR